MKLLVDTNVLVDFLGNRQPFAKKAELLMVAGKVGEFELWASSSQITDLIYILSNGGKSEHMPEVAAAIDGLLDFVNLFAPSKNEVRAALRMNWEDPEDALLYAIAQKIEAHAIISRNTKDFEENLIPVYDCEEFFAQLESEGTVYDFVEL